MSVTGNSLEAVLAEYARREKNAVEILEKLATLYTSNVQSVIFEITDTNNVTTSYEIPSYGYLLSEVKRLSTNQENLSGLNYRAATLVLPDGQTKVVISSELPSEPEPITTLTLPTTFGVKTSRVNVNLLNPLLYVRLNLKDKIKANTEKILIKRLILDIDTVAKSDYFNKNLNYSTLTH